jgi:hypothetical protein
MLQCVKPRFGAGEAGKLAGGRKEDRASEIYSAATRLGGRQ